MDFKSITVSIIHEGLTNALNAGILVRKHNTDELSYYIENNDDTLEVVYRELKNTNTLLSVLCGTVIKPYTWEFEKVFPVLTEEKKYHDPRIWLFQDKAHISFGYYPIILFGEYNNRDKKIESIIHLPICKNFMNGLEKNWGFFEHDKKLCMVYYPQPLIIFEFNIIDNNIVIENISQNLCEELGIGVCGGSPPVLHPTENIYYIFVHKTIIQNNYNIWCVAFTKINSKEWKVKGFTKERLNGGNPADISFPEGAVYDKRNNKWIISGGYKDNSLAFWTISHDDLKSKITWIF